MTKSDKEEKAAPVEKPSCFVIMPIANQPGYDPGHFDKVYQDIIQPAAIEAGLAPIRADDVHATNMIHLDILSRILQAPIAICDLSSVNPNVMFELGIRQAFNKPVVLIKDDSTRDVFDISPIRYVRYEKLLTYRGVLKARDDLHKSIVATQAAKPGEGLNSIVGLLGLKAAALPASTDSPEDARLRLIEKNLSQIQIDIKKMAASKPEEETKGYFRVMLGSTGAVVYFDREDIEALDDSMINDIISDSDATIWLKNQLQVEKAKRTNAKNRPWSPRGK